MRNLAGGGIGWLRRHWRRRRGGRKPQPGPEAVLPVPQALASVEALVSEGVVHRPVSEPSAARARRMEPSAAAPRNAFGRPVQEEVGAGAAGSVAVATGMALAGLRATAFLRGDELHSAHEALHFAADRLAPLVVHVANGDGGHAGYHAVAGAGLFQVLPSSGQEAIDLSLLARWLAERALVPGIVASDGYAVERLRLPGEEMVRAYLRRPDAATPSPTEAQRIVFGTDRPRLLRWFDAERPVATGGMRTELAEAGARLGRRFFFWDHVAELARQGMDELAELTGRPLSFLHRYRLDDAEVVIVAQGAAAEVARAVAAYARRVRHWKVGVVGVTWLRPLPVAELAAALGDRRPVAVVEPADDALAGEPPLFREVRAAVGASDGWISATSAGTWPDPARLLALCELLRRRERPRRVQLERAALPESTGFPRRDALLQRAANGYSGLGSPDLPESESLGIEPKGGRSLALIGREGELPPDALTLFAQAAADACGRFVHGTATRPEPGAWQAQIRAAPAEFLDPGPRDPVGLLLVATDSPRDLGHPLTSVRPGAAVVLATADSPERIWHRLPAAWCREVRERELRVFTVAPAFEAGIAAVAALLRGDEAASLRDGSLREVRWRELEAREPTERELPELVRRIEKVRAAHDSLPRFWGEVVQPRQGGASNGIDDPITASGAVPAGASALDPEPAAAVLPAFDPALCTGCGRCWSACPDAAIGVTVLGSEPLLTAASRVARSEGRVADALRRAHKHLAGRMATEIVKNGAEALSSETCRDAWRWVSSRMDISEADRPEYEAIMGTTIQVASQLQPAVTRPFFHDAEDQGKGKGELLVLAVDPRACQGCNLCVETCPEQALRPLERTHDRYIEFAERWRAWEALPDSPGDTLARAAKHPDVGPLPAALLSRHCAQAQVGGGPGGEPGSGERLAGRLVAAFVEQHAQQQVTHLLGRLEKERETLKQKLSERLSESLSTATPDTLADALARVTRGRAALSELGEQLDALGAPATFDRRSLLRMARLAGEMDRYRQRLVAGEDGLGRARFGVVVTHGSVAEWAARFPGNPYYAPLTLAPTRAGVELARGIARGLVADHLQLQRTLRRARLEAEEAPAGRSARLEAIESLRWEDLGVDDRAGCPPLILLGDDTAMLDHGLDALARVWASDLPIKVVLLDGRGRLDAAPEPALVAMAHQRAFVLASSLAHPEHLARGLADAIAWPGPALIHLHAPSPRRHGFPSEATLARSRAAVESRAHVLFRYDPSAEGMFGLRASLDGNPGLDADWGEIHFAEWAAGETRFAEHFEPLEGDGDAGLPLLDWLALHEPARAGKRPFVELNGQQQGVGERMARATAARLFVWNTLRELTGAGPLADRIRAELEKEFEADFQSRLYELNTEHLARIAELRAGDDQQAVVRLRDRLMTLAGYPPKGQPQGDVE